MSNFNSSSGFMSSVPVVTKNLIIINALFWLASAILPKVGIDITSFLGLRYIGSDQFIPSQLITYMFLHDPGSITHVLFNMFGVYMFGRVLEQVWGPKRFLTFYLVTGVGAAIVQEIMWYLDLRPFFAAIEQYGSSNNLSDLLPYLQKYGASVSAGVTIPSHELFVFKEGVMSQMVTIGASGSVFGILLGFGMLFPNAPLYLMFIPVPIKAKYMVVGYGLIELFAGVANFSGDNVAHFAHLGGMLFGFFLIRFWKKKGIGNGFFLG